MSKPFVIRMVLWTALMLYLVCDFFIFSGPLKHELRRMYPTDEDQLAKAIEEGICAKVYNQPIYLSQVDRRVREHLWRAGRDPGKISEKEGVGLRWVALNELIDAQLMRVKTRANEEDAPVSDAEVDAEVVRFEKRFASAEELDKAMEIQGVESRKELRYRLAARLQQEKYVLKRIHPRVTVSDADARKWYEDHKEKVTMPERRKVRHVFLPTLDHPSEQVKETLEAHLISLKAGKITWRKLAAEFSEDTRSKGRGGELGWVRKNRLPGDFAAAVFSLPVDSPTLIRTKIGWHILEVTAIKAAELLPYEAMKAEITTGMSDMRREAAIKQYRHQLRVFSQEKIEIYNELLK